MAPSKTEKKSDDAERVSAGNKHQTSHDSSEPKQTRNKRQKTLEETMSKDESEDKGDAAEQEQNQDDDDAVEENEDKKTEDSKPTDSDKPANGKNKSAVEPHQEENVPSNILEKGIVYFLIRGRVNIETPSEVDEIRRTYMLLRPIEKDAKLGDGPIGDAGNSRLVAIPKKVLPLSGRDRFMAFVEKAGVSFDEIKNDFMASSDYETKTAGSRHAPAARPVGEGVYAITSTGRESHFAYMLTLPEKPETVQGELGLKEKGSFILSTKNPKFPGPANANLPQGPEFSEDVMEEFRDLRWMSTKPSHLDYVNAQILLIGESSGIDKAVEPQKEDQKADAKEPMEVLEDLEEEDLKRMKDLPGDDSASIFADLQARANDYPKLQTTF
ncbi:hypothetical protein HJFPF1_12685 [Paramyrothecium foliicola]|nr:hypothetical protein HJFPF1_12685 [Paramyrothecium foliicola]